MEFEFLYVQEKKTRRWAVENFAANLSKQLCYSETHGLFTVGLFFFKLYKPCYVSELFAYAAPAIWPHFYEIFEQARCLDLGD